MIDFALPGALAAALLVAFAFPVLLWLVTRIPRFAGRNAKQFLVTTIAMFALWAVATAAFPPFRPSGFADILIGMMALAGAALLYLEIWGLMSRGYTLSILIALLEAGRPLSSDEIAAAYRGGDGLDWIMRHRLGGLEDSGMVSRDGDAVILTPGRGALVARLYRLSILILGLGRTG